MDDALAVAPEELMARSGLPAPVAAAAHLLASLERARFDPEAPAPDPGAVRRAIEELPDDARQTLVLREVEGLSYAEIAESLSIPKGTVMSRLHHARRKVREALVAMGAVDSAGEVSA